MKNIIIFLILTITSCEVNTQNTNYDETYKKLINKTTFDKINKRVYTLAFDDGTTYNTSFGYYSCIEIGDTVLFVKPTKNSIMYIMQPKCK